MSQDDQSGARWWETAEDHRFALEVLQLGIRRKMLKFIGSGIRTKEEIAREFGLRDEQAGYHLTLLEKALVVEHVKGYYKATSTGIFYLENVEAKR
ncbi:MAG: hypothetical protein ACE14P_12185 [Methanotrichaceae archaeon]